jgi:hypothetical protein
MPSMVENVLIHPDGFGNECSSGGDGVLLTCCWYVHRISLMRHAVAQDLDPQSMYDLSTTHGFVAFLNGFDGTTNRVGSIRNVALVAMWFFRKGAAQLSHVQRTGSKLDDQDCDHDE